MINDVASAQITLVVAMTINISTRVNPPVCLRW
jgi:hypothetical protein